VRGYPALRSVTLRLLELLAAPEESQSAAPVTGANGAPAIVFEQVTAHAGGHEVLRAIDLRVGPGEHVAVVGASGAGKSSLVGLLLGWLTPAQGRLLVDGVPLEGAALTALRQRTAWLDPAVHLWNQPLLDNILYGSPAEAVASMPGILAASDLRGVLPRLPDGLQTELGDSGALLSGGEGQRVRLARALTRAQAGLVILDEPFRGLDREQRRALVARARAAWPEATLFCVSHDIAATLDFDRVLVIADGALVEEGAPAALAGTASRYRALLDAEEHLRTGLWGSFRRLRLERGALEETGS
jgi:ABC-type transport system involved in cytochrome bd biosynthesis fused ATPase/permease subunit